VQYKEQTERDTHLSDESKRKITIYTDGGADPNPGVGGWAVILVDQRTGVTKELSGSELDTTNNRMELTAAIRALEAVKQPCYIDFYTDSEYLRRGITEWLDNWESNGWQREGSSVSNRDLWEQLPGLIFSHTINWLWVKGHAGNRYNERADQLARDQIRRHDKRETVAFEYEVFITVSCKSHIGGWAALVRTPGGESVISGGRTPASANQLNIIAAAKALRSLPKTIRVACWTTSDYLRNGATQWLASWKLRDWISKDGKPVANSNEWKQLEEEMSSRIVEWPSVKAQPRAEFSRLEATARAEAGQKRRN
jgi:ribonuclease HI